MAAYETKHRSGAHGTKVRATDEALIRMAVKAMGIDSWAPLTVLERDLIRRALSPVSAPENGSQAAEGVA